VEGDRVASRAPTGFTGCLIGTKLVQIYLTAYMHAIANLCLLKYGIYRQKSL